MARYAVAVLVLWSYEHRRVRPSLGSSTGALTAIMTAECIVELAIPPIRIRSRSVR
jgi:hypothetical protein